MNTPSVTGSGLLDRPPPTVRTLQSRPERRVGLLDRAALHLGVALITWGRRPARRGRPALTRNIRPNDRQVEELRDSYELWGVALTRLK